MARIVVVQNGASAESLTGNVGEALSVSGATTVAVVNDPAWQGPSGSRRVVFDDTPVSDTLWPILAESGNEPVLFLDARLPVTGATLEHVLRAAETGDTALAFCSLSSGDESVDLEGVSAERIVGLLSPGSRWPLAIAVVQPAFLREIEPFAATTTAEFLVQFCVAALGSHFPIDGDLVSIEAPSTVIREISEVSPMQLAQCLRFAVNSVNIEEMFPNHAWEQHGNESAAASYHTISATFIKLHDFESALECLSLSEQLEESPRSLALRGLVASCQGETLQAVANLVSSLQEYEKRKDPNQSEHYLVFAPRDLEKINADLQSGLDALNRRDNSSALSFFADAVFEFDSFYQDCGLDQVRRPS